MTFQKRSQDKPSQNVQGQGRVKNPSPTKPHVSYLHRTVSLSFPRLSPSFRSSHVGFLDLSEKAKAHPQLRTFALTLLLDVHMACSLLHSGLCSVSSTHRASLLPPFHKSLPFVPCFLFSVTYNSS